VNWKVVLKCFVCYLYCTVRRSGALCNCCSFINHSETLFPQVSQGDAAEELAHQVAAPAAAADRGPEEASGDPHEEEEDEAHQSSKGHVSGKYGLCCTEGC